MNLNHLYYFLSVVDLKHITKAATINHVSQSTMSMSIRSLENELGVSLIKNDGRNIEITEYGLIFANYVRKCLTILEDGINEITYLQDAKAYTLRLITTSLLGVNIMPKLLSLFHSCCPDIEVRITQGTNRDVLNSLINCQSDFGLTWMNSLNSYDEIVQYPIFEEEIFIMVPNDHRLANEKSINIEWLKNESIIMFSETTGFKQSVINICNKHGFEPYILHEAVDNFTVAALVEGGNGVAFVCQIGGINREKVNVIPITNNELKSTICVAWNKNIHESKSTLDFRNFLIKTFPKINFN